MKNIIKAYQSEQSHITFHNLQCKKLLSESHTFYLQKLNKTFQLTFAFAHNSDR